jgi:ketosteroid isomerase-like protein
MRKCCLALLALAMVATSGCVKKVDLEAERAALMKADADWSAAIGTKDPNTFIAFVAADGTIMPPNNPAVGGSDAILAWATATFAMPGFAVSWQATSAEVASSGDLGYTTGAYDFQGQMPDGTPMTDRGKYATVWEKQADGTWKVVVDIFNSDMPMMPMAAQSDTTSTPSQ